jgi:hypothetical protein
MNSLAVGAAAPAANEERPLKSLSRRAKVGMISLGCAKNLVDAEIMLGSVLRRGMEITARAEDADVLVVNTCAFIDSAKEESIGAILEAHNQRGLSRRPNQKLIVSGCMAQRFARELRQEMPEVDAFIGLDQVADVGSVVEEVLGKYRPRVRGQEAHLHPRLRHTALQAYAGAFRLRKDCRRLQSPVQFLRDSANARKTSQPSYPISPRGNPGTRY